MLPIYLTPFQQERRRYQEINDDIKVKLSRLLQLSLNKLGIDDSTLESTIKFSKLNSLINRANSLIGIRPYVLKPDDWGEYSASEIAWHENEFEAAIFRLTTPEFIEFVAELVDREFLELDLANSLLSDGNCDVMLRRDTNNQISVDLIENEGAVELSPNSNPNLRQLVDRMDRSIENEDYPNTLSASASVIETISKELLLDKKVSDQSFGSYAEAYAKRTGLPEPVTGWLREIYNWRNREPLAGHGHTAPPTISKNEAVVIAEFTKAFIRVEQFNKLSSDGKRTKLT
ncbi:hypothetical protein QPX44_09060 [Corynebacterium pseudodiphtheriticum]|uniref:hypothetical protein n=1 Tax=Corynebacterium pseudodiphtheriticum TaxID=37637 RepID=UPI0025415FAC|nr:hypothetical protein [Corynebacterium pseudodiphtheriticum]MDK4272956.1 hypothetical protein [Corynebacterium pseudodiphtheriticum]MDK4286054.1 hypothetical protein [Corynebacterium pseudodiphtheriticum]MDK4288549.1 hypothetical protein [Corynebacterium pseudodiphtheriticum]MDK4316305.1 hypothetical protein [Corynebacterium pseudodiphtheriticum]